MKKVNFLKYTMLSLLVAACLFSFTFENEGFFPDEIQYEFQKGDNPTITKKFTLNGTGTLDVTTSGGKIMVEGHSGNEVEVQAFFRKNGRTVAPSGDVMDRINEVFEFRIEQSGNNITAFAKKIKNGRSWNNMGIAFTVYTPYAMTCDLKTSGGGITVSKVEGTQSFNTSGGGIKLSEIKGQVKARTSGGGITVSDQNGNLDLHTSGGRIQVMNAIGNVDGHTSGGGIKLENINGDANVHTSGGGIKINGSMQYVKASTSGGGITVDIEGLNKELNLHTSGGGIRANIPGGLGMNLYLKGNDVDVDLQNFSGTSKKGRVEGTMNGGGIPVKMTTSGGNVDLVFKNAAQ